MTKDEAAFEFRFYREDGSPASGIHHIRRDLAEQVAEQLGVSMDELIKMKRDDIRQKILAGEIVL